MRVDFTEQMLNGRLFQTIGPMKEKGHIVTVHGIPFILQFGLKYFATVGFLQFLNFRCVFFCRLVCLPLYLLLAGKTVEAQERETGRRCLVVCLPEG